MLAWVERDNVGRVTGRKSIKLALGVPPTAVGQFGRVFQFETGLT